MTVNFENCFNLERVIMPYSDSLERPEISQPLKAINSTLSWGGGYSKGYDLQLKIHFYVYDIILFSNPL